MRFRRDRDAGDGASPPPDSATRVVDPGAAPTETISAPPPSATARVEDPAAVKPPDASPGAAPPSATARAEDPPSPSARVDAPPPGAGTRVDAPPPGAGTRVDAPPPQAEPPKAGKIFSENLPGPLQAAGPPPPDPGAIATPPPQAGQLVSPAAAPAAAAGATTCPSCGTPAHAGQEMCIACGSRIAPPVGASGASGGRGWRLPVVLAAIALLLVGTGIAFAVVELTSDDEVKKGDVADLSDDPKPPVTQPPTTTQPPPTTAPAPTTPAPTIPPATREPQPTKPQDPPDSTPPTTPDTPSGGGSVAEWPAGRTAYTVVLVSATSRNAADAKAEQAVKRGIQAGVLRSDDFSTLRPGYWVVFAGQYDSSEEATRAADRYAEQGFGGGYPRQVKPK